MSNVKNAAGLRQSLHRDIHSVRHCTIPVCYLTQKTFRVQAPTRVRPGADRRGSSVAKAGVETAVGLRTILFSVAMGAAKASVLAEVGPFGDGLVGADWTACRGRT
jgi:hypothetical protein